MMICLSWWAVASVAFSQIQAQYQWQQRHPAGLVEINIYSITIGNYMRVAILSFSIF